jgi:hypothetical protein
MGFVNSTAFQIFLGIVGAQLFMCILRLLGLKC